MAFKIEHGEQPMMSEINVTPFVDVMLVLLIIFMVTAPMMIQGIKVQMPEVDTRAISGTGERVIISLTDKGDIYIEEFKVPLTDLGLKVKNLLELRKTSEVFLRADKSVAYGKVVTIMAEVRKAGIENMGLVTEAEKVRKP